MREIYFRGDQRIIRLDRPVAKRIDNLIIYYLPSCSVMVTPRILRMPGTSLA